MGTVGYMSPEQALGKTVDYRSDQFSLGAILYEMATGRRAFQRGSAPRDARRRSSGTSPSRSPALNPKVPAPLRWTVERCLAKEPRNRYASTEDLARELATIRDHLSEASGAIAAPSRAGRDARDGGAGCSRLSVAAAVLLAAAVGMVALGPRPTTPGRIRSPAPATRG